jgi:hypothetical protein
MQHRYSEQSANDCTQPSSRSRFECPVCESRYEDDMVELFAAEKAKSVSSGLPLQRYAQQHPRESKELSKMADVGPRRQSVRLQAQSQQIASPAAATLANQQQQQLMMKWA